MLEGHAFLVEAAVCLGGRTLPPGVSVYRYANRIPLLFEAGSDVMTRTALRRINWGAYRINATTDRVRMCVCVWLGGWVGGFVGGCVCVGWWGDSYA